MKNFNNQIFRIFVPVYNEELAIRPLSESMKQLRTILLNLGISLEVYFVNDASTDHSAREIQTAIDSSEWIRVITHPQNRGLVGVLETFLKDWDRDLKEGETLLGLGMLDGDDSHPTGSFLEMIPKIVAGYDVVIASRFVPGSVVRGVPGNRQLYSLVMSWMFRAFGRFPNVKDYSCGFRAYSPHILSKIRSGTFKSRSFACMVELLKMCHLQGATFIEVPFCLRYDKKLSASKMNVVRTIKETLKVLF